LLLATLIGYAQILAMAPMAALAAPFSQDPVSFAGFANNIKWSSGSQPFFRNLGSCEQVVNGGYLCRSGQVYKVINGKAGRSFCELEQVWYEPNNRTVQYRTRSCAFKGDRQRLEEQGQKLLQKGLNLLENYSR
jgi:hypothetical protein